MGLLGGGGGSEETCGEGVWGPELSLGVWWGGGRRGEGGQE